MSFTNLQKEVLDGCLLGDGCLFLGKNASLYLQKNIIDGMLLKKKSLSMF